jgi:hypothetical protein
MMKTGRNLNFMDIHLYVNRNRLDIKGDNIFFNSKRKTAGFPINQAVLDPPVSLIRTVPRTSWTTPDREAGEGGGSVTPPTLSHT